MIYSNTARGFLKGEIEDEEGGYCTYSFLLGIPSYPLTTIPDGCNVLLLFPKSTLGT